jgi:vitamin B12 transporter
MHSLVFIFYSLFSNNSFAINSLKPIQVTAEKISKDLDKVSSSVIIFNREDLENSNAVTLKELLKKSAGIYIRESGAFGKTSSLYIRGANTSYTKVIIDGIKVNDPTSSEGEFDFSNFTLENIEKVEIIKGAQGVLYGPDALAGVIKITTKKGKSQPVSSIRVGYGSFDNKTIQLNSSGKKYYFDYAVGVDAQKVEGISAFNEDRTANADKDGHEHLNLNLNLGYSISNKTRINTIVKRNYSNTEVDGFVNFVDADKSGAYHEVNQNLYLVGLENKLLNKKLESSLKIGRFEIDKDFYDPNLTAYKGRTNTIEQSNVLNLKDNDIYFGVRFDHSDVKSNSFSDPSVDKSSETKGIFLGNYIDFGKTFTDQGLAYDDFGKFGNEITYRLGVGHKLTSTSIVKSSYATGFKTPSIDQLYASYGNENLKAFQSKNFELSITQNWGQTYFQVTYFKTIIEDEIVYSSLAYSNIAKTDLYGFEFLAGTIFFDSIRSDFSAEFIRTERRIRSGTSGYLSERPREKYSVLLEFLINDKLSINLDQLYVGKRQDTVESVSSYYLLDTKINYEYGENTRIDFSINNLLDKDYEEVRNFGTLGREFKTSIKWKI